MCVDLETGELHRPEHVQALIEGVARRIESLGVGECAKLAKYLRNRAPGLVLAHKSVLPRLEALAEPWSVQAVSLGCICWYLVRELHKRPAHARRRALSRHLLGAYGALQDRLGPESASLLDAIEEVLHQRHRASSAIEGFNAALRPYLYVHKGATQGFLDLFRAWFNLRTRRWGRHKGTSAHECLTGQRVHDWLTLLGYPPSPTHHRRVPTRSSRPGRGAPIRLRRPARAQGAQQAHRQWPQSAPWRSIPSRSASDRETPVESASSAAVREKAVH